MAKDPTDNSTRDFIPHELNVTRGQVLMDRNRHIAIVAKKGRDYAHLVQVKSGKLGLARYTAEQLYGRWLEAEYPFERAVSRLIEHGKQHGMTDAARRALDDLVIKGREPKQNKLFD